MKTQYVPGTYTSIPQHLVSYRRKYKAVGRNVMVKLDNKATVNELQADKRTLEQIAKLYPNMKFGQIVSKMMGGGYRKATLEEVDDYRLRKARLDNYVREVLRKRDARRAEEDRRQIAKATQYLERRGLTVVPAPAADQPAK